MSNKEREYKIKQNEIYDPEEDYFDVRKQEQSVKKYDPYKKIYKSTFNKENPY